MVAFILHGYSIIIHSNQNAVWLFNWYFYCYCCLSQWRSPAAEMYWVRESLTARMENNNWRELNRKIVKGLLFRELRRSKIGLIVAWIQPEYRWVLLTSSRCCNQESVVDSWGHSSVSDSYYGQWKRSGKVCWRQNTAQHSSWGCGLWRKTQWALLSGVLPYCFA